MKGTKTPASFAGLFSDLKEKSPGNEVAKTPKRGDLFLLEFR